MPNHLELPDDFQHLIEKREVDRRAQTDEDSAEQLPDGVDRRKNDRRQADDRLKNRE